MGNLPGAAVVGSLVVTWVRMKGYSERGTSIDTALEMPRKCHYCFDSMKKSCLHRLCISSKDRKGILSCRGGDFSGQPYLK